MNVKKSLKRIAIVSAVLITPLVSAEDFFGTLPDPTQPSAVETNDKFKEWAVSTDTIKKQWSVPQLVAQLKSLLKEQKKFFSKYESGVLNSTKDIASFKIDLALLEFNTNEVLTQVDEYLKHQKFVAHGTSGMTQFDEVLEQEEKMRVKIETLISAMKFNQDRKFFKHRLMYEIKLGEK